MNAADADLLWECEMGCWKCINSILEEARLKWPTVTKKRWKSQSINTSENKPA